MRSWKRKLYFSWSSKSKTALTVLQLHDPDLLCNGGPHHLAQAHPVQQHRAASPPALVPFPGPASVLLLIYVAIDWINNSVIPCNGRRIANVYNFSTLALSLVGAVIYPFINLTAVADADIVVLTAVAVITVLFFYAFWQRDNLLEMMESHSTSQC